MRWALAVALLAVLLAALGGCSGKPTQEAPQDRGERTSDDRDATSAEWTGTDCLEHLLESYVPAAVVQPLVPDGYVVREFAPGMAIVGVVTSQCVAWRLGNSSDAVDLTDVRQARLQVLLASLDWLVLEWLVSDPTLAEALTARGFSVAAGDVSIGTGALPGARTVAVTAADGPRATYEWMVHDGGSSDPSTDKVLQVVGGQPRSLAVTMDVSWVGSFTDLCTVQAEDATWVNAIGTERRDCLPFVAETDLGVVFSA